MAHYLCAQLANLCHVWNFVYVCVCIVYDMFFVPFIYEYWSNTNSSIKINQTYIQDRQIVEFVLDLLFHKKKI